MDNSEILSPPPIEIINEFLDNIPTILKWRDIREPVLTPLSDFPQFEQLPLELKTKIFSEYPTKSMLSINKELTQGLEESYYESYCLNQSVNRQEIINYFNSMEYGDSISFRLLRLIDYGDEIILFNESFNIIVIEESDEPFFLSSHNFMEDTSDDIGYFLDGEDLINYFSRHPKTYFLIFDNYTTKDIVSHRLSCNTENYPDIFVKILNETFLSYFSPYPLIANEYLDFIDINKTHDYNNYIKQFEDQALEEPDYSIFVTTDLNSQLFLSDYYMHILIKNDFL